MATAGGALGSFDGDLIIDDNNAGHGMTNFSSPTITLAAGTYRIRSMTREGGGGAGAQLSWQAVSGTPLRVGLWKPLPCDNDLQIPLLKQGSGSAPLIASTHSLE